MTPAALQRRVELLGLLMIAATASGCIPPINSYQKIEVTSVPAGATIMDDEGDIHVTPAKVKLWCYEEHDIAIGAAGYRTQLASFKQQEVPFTTWDFWPAFFGMHVDYVLVPQSLAVELQPLAPGESAQPLDEVILEAWSTREAQARAGTATEGWIEDRHKKLVRDCAAAKRKLEAASAQAGDR